MKAAKPKRTEVHIPFTIVDLDEPNIFPAEGLTDVDPLLVPADPAIVTDAPDFIVAGVLERGKARGVRPR